MSEEKKGVDVTVLPTNGQPYDVNHPRALDIKVLNDGHLYVLDTRNNILAIYAPSRWHSAVVHR